MKAFNSNCMQEKPMHIRKFKRKKDGKVVEAIHCTGDLATVSEVIVPRLSRGDWSGAIVLEQGDWLVNCGTTIPFSCTPEAFAEHFEPVEEPSKHTDKPNAKPELKTLNLTFGEALELIKQGYLVKRKGWNGKGQFLYLINAQDLQKGLNYGYGEVQGEPTIQDSIAIKTSANQIQIGWLASQSDMLANDWIWLNPPKSPK